MSADPRQIDANVGRVRIGRSVAVFRTLGIATYRRLITGMFSPVLVHRPGIDEFYPDCQAVIASSNTCGKTSFAVGFHTI